MRARVLLAIALWSGLAAMSFAAPRVPAQQPSYEAIVVPFTDAPFTRLVDPQSNVAFDFAGVGDVRSQGWLTPNAAWLVWDPQWRGEVHTGADLVNQRTLRQLDANHDGQISGAELAGLALWRDENDNGVAEPGEVLPVNVHGITALSARAAVTQPGLMVAPAGIRFDDGHTRPLYDWTLRAPGT